MTRETKVGLGVAATVFLVVGGALVYKLYFLVPRTGELAQSTTSSVSEPHIVPARSEASTATTNSFPPQQTTPFQPEIRSGTESPPLVQTSGEPTPPLPPTTLPPPPPILIADKPPVSLADAEKASAKVIDASQSRDSSPVRTSIPTPAEPTGSPFSSAATNLAEPPPPSKPTSPVLPPPPAVDKADPVPTGVKPSPVDRGESANQPLPPPPPVVVTLSDSPPGKPPAPGATTLSPASDTPQRPAEKPPLGAPEGLASPDLPEARPSADRLKPTTSGPSTPNLNVTVPAPPPSDAFDRSYPAPPASLVAARNNQPKPEDAIPVTIRPQTQPLTPSPPDAYPVKIVPSPSGNRVEVLDYEVQRYAAGPGETWEGISRNKYGSERYARALAAFNRDRNPGLTIPSPGAIILLPPADILQRRYPQLLSSPSALTLNDAGVSVPPANAVSGSPNLRPGVNPSTATSPAISGAYKLYRVQPNDTIWLIAKRTLGTGERWPEIFRLNRDVLRDVNQLPPGLILRLPPDAGVDENALPR